MWFTEKAWGVSWKMTAAIVNPSQQTSTDSNRSHSDKERELFGSVTTAVELDDEVEHAEPEPVSTTVEDSDEEPERPPTPPPVEKPKKKILKKKA